MSNNRYKVNELMGGYDRIADQAATPQGDAWEMPQMQAPQAVTNPQSSQTGGAVDAASKGMMMSGNPYLMGAAMGLQVLSQAEAAKRQRKEQAVSNEMERRNRLMASMSRLGSGLA